MGGGKRMWILARKRRAKGSREVDECGGETEVKGDVLESL